MKEFIIYPKKFLTLTAIWPFPKKKICSLYNIRSFVFSYLLMAALTISITIETTKSITDLQKWTDSALFGITEINFMIKFIFFIQNRKQFIELLKSVNTPMFLDHKCYHEFFFKNWLKIAHMYCRCYYIICLSCCVFYSIYPFLDTTETRSLPLCGWLPFDGTSNTFIYICVYIFQVISLFVCTINNASLDLLPSVLMNFGCVQFDILKHKLENAIRNSSHESNTDEQLTEDENRAVLKILAQCVDHHNAINK